MRQFVLLELAALRTRTCRVAIFTSVSVFVYGWFQEVQYGHGRIYGFFIKINNHEITSIPIIRIFFLISYNQHMKIYPAALKQSWQNTTLIYLIQATEYSVKSSYRRFFNYKNLYEFFSKSTRFLGILVQEQSFATWQPWIFVCVSVADR